MEAEEVGERLFADLPNEILLQIFHKLGLKSVVRCKLVCKKWRSLISDPFFTSSYTPNNTTSFIMIPRVSYYTGAVKTTVHEIDTGYYRRRPGHKRFWTEFSDEEGSSGVKVLGTWNGLVALHNCRRGFLLCNPWTREEKRVRVADDHDFGSRFDLYGLCHDPATDEYKAVLSNCGCSHFYVVSFKDGECRSKPQPSLIKRLNRHGYGLASTVVKGVPHWIQEKGRPPWIDMLKSEPRLSSDPIVCFDQQKEEFGEAPRLPLPEDDDGGRLELMGLGALDGRLSVAVSGRLVGGLDVWGLKDDNSWTKLFAIVNLPPSTNVSLLSPLAADDNKVLINRKHEAFLTVYDFRDRSLQDLAWLNVIQRRPVQTIAALATRALLRQPHRIVTFVPSLVSPNHPA